jgi:GTP pyrophosphokinase
MSSLTAEERKEIEKQYHEILVVCPRCRTDEERQKIRKAFDLAVEAHKGMRRRSGEPYIYHPIEVAKISAGEIGLGTTSVICSLLHDVVEDTDYTLEDIRNLFGEKVMQIIDGLTKISTVYNQDASLQAENFRKMLLTLSDDVRVILIKLADRLHNMRTLDSMPEYKQLKIAAETIFLYAPLAHRLGLYAMKTELEDLSLKYQHPPIYDEIRVKLEAGEKDRESYIERFKEPIVDKLQQLNIKYSISGRTKSVYSIYNKMQLKSVPFEEIYDLFAIRIIFDPDETFPEKTQCWNIYSLVTDIYQPKPDRLRDWVSTPKANGYEALHTTVMGPNGLWVEVQIRSRRMEEIAERGYAAHWKYKGGEADESEFDRWIKKIRELLENPESNALEFIDEFKMNLFSSEIFVFTPKGELRRLPKDSTALDFAYDVHSKIGDHAIGAKVNFKLVPLSYPLKSGDQIQILTSDKQEPQKDWLDFVTTAKAKAKIKEKFKSERKAHVDHGKELLELKFKEIEMPITSVIFRRLLTGYEVFSKEELYYLIGKGDIDLTEVKKVLNRKSRNKWIRYWQLQISKTTSRLPLLKRTPDQQVRPTGPAPINRKETMHLNDETDNRNYSIAKCCNPIPGDDVVGYSATPVSIIIHKKNCPNALKLMSSFGEKIVTVKWTTHKVLSYLARIRLNGIDNIGIVNNITNHISKELDVNMRTLYFDAHDGIFEGYIDLYVHSTYDLDKLTDDLRKMKGINSVKRVEEYEEDN